MICGNSRITREKLAEAIGKSVRTVQRITDKLAQDGYITRTGKNGYGYWQVSEEHPEYGKTDKQDKKPKSL